LISSGSSRRRTEFGPGSLPLLRQRTNHRFAEQARHKHYYSNKNLEDLHREDGPAIEHSDGYKEWYVDGKELTEAQFINRNRPKKLKRNALAGQVVDVDGVKA